MEQIRAKTEAGSMYILRTDSEAGDDILWGNCLKIDADGTHRVLGTIALQQETLEIGSQMIMTIPSERDGAETYRTTDVVGIDRQEIEEVEVPFIEAFREVGLQKGLTTDSLEEFVDKSLDAARGLIRELVDDTTL